MIRLNTHVFDFENILNCSKINQKISGNGGAKPPSNSNCIGKKDSGSDHQPDTIAVTDIGNNKIVVFIARLHANNKIEIIGYGEERAEGVTKGVVSDIPKVSKYLKSALDKAAKQAGFVPKSISVGVSCAIKTHEHQAILIRKNPNSEISANDILVLESEINHAHLYAGEKILCAELQYFSVDGENGILDPIEMTGARLEAVFKLITCHSVCIKNLEKCCSLIHISLKAVYPSVIASAEAILHHEEMKEGIAIVDIGAGKSGVAIYKDGFLLHAETIPYGGENITNDISSYTGLPFREAEEIKIRYANTIHNPIDPNEAIGMELFNQSGKIILMKDLAFVIQCRLTEILNLIDSILSAHIRKEDIVFGVVFTGGTSKIPLFNQLVKNAFNKDLFTLLDEKYIFTKVNSEVIGKLNIPIYTSGLGVLKLSFH